MSYLYEMHLHTSLGSRCGRSKGSDYIDYYLEKGYDGIFVTDHFFLGNTCIDRKLPWEEWVNQYYAAYEEAKAAGDKKGLKVFFGWETTYQGDDFLIYGLGKDFLLAHPDIIHWDQTKQYQEVKKAGGAVVQAHPFRERGYMNTIHLHPFQCDAFEVMNACNEPYQNVLAYKYAVNHGMKMTVGSDIHFVNETSYNNETFAMVTEEPLNSAEDYAKLLLSGKGFSNNVPEAYFKADIRDTDLPIMLHNAENEVIDYDRREFE